MSWMHKYAELRKFGVQDAIVLDTEFVARRGEQVQPVCLTAMSLFSGREWREFYRPEAPLPLPVDVKTLYVTYSAPSEWSYFLAAGWPLPISVIDLFAERMLLTNGAKDARGKRHVPSLLSSLEAYSIDAMSAAEKMEMRDLILRGGPFSPEEQTQILTYCMEDTLNTRKLFDAMLPTLDIARAIQRGSYTRVVASVEYHGVPVDTDAIAKLKSDWPAIMVRLAEKLEFDHHYGVYSIVDGRAKWSTGGFNALVHRVGLARTWPKTKTGQFSTSDGGKGGEVFKQMAELRPELKDLRQLKKTFGEMKVFDLPVGQDGRCRTYPFPWWTSTSRNQPKKGSIFSLPKWARFLANPAPGRALAYIDLVAAEFGIASALSHDAVMQGTYRSAEDNYLHLAKLAGAVPADATKKSHPQERKIFKISMLGSQYDMSEFGLAQKLEISVAEARSILDDLKRIYKVYFSWIEWAVFLAQANHVMTAPMGWRITVNQDTNPRSLFNFPMQCSCAEILRVATVMMLDNGIQLCALVHDAVLIEAPLDRLGHDVLITQQCWAEASKIVLDGFALESDCVITEYPDRYFDEDGEHMWNKLQEMIEA
jgi:DNA polymerase-1